MGVDIIPALPPKGVSTIQGNFLCLEVQEEVKKFLMHPNRGQTRPTSSINEGLSDDRTNMRNGIFTSLTESRPRKVQIAGIVDKDISTVYDSTREKGETKERVVNVVLSDMSAPWKLTEGYWKRSLSDPYFRMMNTSGINFRDHAGSMVHQPSLTIKWPLLMKLNDGRIYVMRPYASYSTLYVSAAISFANFIKDLRIRPLNNG